MPYTVAQYRSDTGRLRWGVLHSTSRVWYFAARYGRRAALDLRNRLALHAD